MQLGIIAVDVSNSSPTKSEGVKGERSPSKSSTVAAKRDPSPSQCPTWSLTSSNESSPPRISRYLDGCGLMSGVEVTYVATEGELFEKLVQLVKQVDPDFLLGYEITMASWGYLIDRAAKLNIHLTSELSRMPSEWTEVWFCTMINDLWCC